ncbi:phage tail protein [Burkholderia stagnalis]|uniref:phage tail assembly chaperone n=1 Tax=Burkholderia stagnalis TaxID=1503054 RepID=UPI00075E3043|nr:phage tail assembly chaperone [Burkholderia stagnalis]KVM85820.1 phage tail protein [Burkholderia stagnalis]RQQ12629.1 phage tail protein [Burkholderia stagnalis]RQQ17692.1 phage tail protein [Burkholderia stagnalis]RQQ33950.1 phage tail protein [Burkholderia stagnalis]RQQ36092.1 phage tail protein [Burkholderia stagnalis]
MGQKQAAYDSNSNIVAFYDKCDSPPPSGTNVVDISDDEWRISIEGQSRGKRAMLDGNMHPVLIDPPAPTRADVAASMRSKRDAAIDATDWFASRHQDETLIGNGTTLTAAQFSMLIKYRQALRDISGTEGWPYVVLPSAPDFVTAIA